jgi:hypothetical protein
MISTYEEKKQAKITRKLERAEKLDRIADANRISKVYGEENSGIPLGQPILVGHHSERRHRNQLKRMENRVRKGFEAAEKAEKLRQSAAATESNQSIDIQNPQAKSLIDEKIEKLEMQRDHAKVCNKLLRKSKTVEELASLIKNEIPETKNALKLATNLMTPDFAGRVGVPAYHLAGLGAEIRRLKQRRQTADVVQSGFGPYAVGDITVEFIDGQIQVAFGFKPSEEIRTKLKTSPLAMKWSSYSKRWVRKHTASTAARWWAPELRKVLEECNLERAKPL